MDRRRHGSLLLALAATTLVALVDASLGNEVIIIGLLSIGPLVAAAVGLGPRRTGAVALYALALGLAVGQPDGIFATVDHGARLLTVAVAGTLSVGLALMRRRREAGQAELAASEERFRRLVDGVRDYAIFVVDPAGRVSSWNLGAERICGWREEEVVGEHVGRLGVVDGDEREIAAALEAASREGGYERQAWWTRRDGTRFHAQLTVNRLLRADGEVYGYAVVVQDITRRVELEAQLSHLALHDPLTGLPNRTLFVDHAVQALARATRHDARVAVLFLDLDRFKLVNDSLGHAAGDELLVAVAERVRAAVREEDTVGRLGGDEFVVLCEDIGAEGDAVAVAERAIEALKAPVVVAGNELFARSSIGIALARPGERDPEELLRDADSAMYQAKQQGAGRWEVFREDERPDALKRILAESELHQATEREGFHVVYQPVMELATGRLVAVEALARWNHPERGPLAPGEFIPLAEETGLIHPIGAFVLETACRQAASWAERCPDAPALRVLVNVSARQLARPDLLALIDTSLERTGLDPDALCLEITESSLMTHDRKAMISLMALRGLGVHLAIDDFGTGYSSLSYLKRFPVSYLKVDRSFVEGLGRRGEDTALVGAITSMGQALGLTVIAEGVEEPDQLAALRDLGCELAQGYLLEAPQAAEALDDLVCRDRLLVAP